MTTRVELPNGQWVAFNDDLSVGDIETINGRMQVWDGDVEQWRADEIRAVIESSALLIEEWSVTDADGQPMAPTPDNVRKLPARSGRHVIRALSDHLKNLGLSEEE